MKKNQEKVNRIVASDWWASINIDRKLFLCKKYGVSFISENKIGKLYNLENRNETLVKKEKTSVQITKQEGGN